MRKINLAISGCMGRMGQQLIKSARKDIRFKISSLTENQTQRKKILGIPCLPTSLAFGFVLGAFATFAEPAIGVLRAAGAGVDPTAAPLLWIRHAQVPS